MPHTCKIEKNSIPLHDPIMWLWPSVQSNRVSQNTVPSSFFLSCQLILSLGIKVKAFLKSVWNSLPENIQHIHFKQNVLWWSLSIHFQRWQIYFIIWLDSWCLWLNKLIMGLIIGLLRFIINLTGCCGC